MKILHSLPFPCTAFPCFFQSHLISFHSCLVHQHGMSSPLHFHFTQTTSLDFFLLACHAFQKGALTSKDNSPWSSSGSGARGQKNLPMYWVLIVLNNCNGAAMAKNNTNQKISILSSILLWDASTHLILIETTVPGSIPVWKWILFPVICYCECPGHLWSIPAMEDQTAAAVPSPQLVLLKEIQHSAAEWSIPPYVWRS